MLLGKRKGDEVTVQRPQGEVRLTIVAVRVLADDTAK
jgi:transcription elongation GreA/GreB family factor